MTFKQVDKITKIECTNVHLTFIIHLNVLKIKKKIKTVYLHCSKR